MSRFLKALLAVVLAVTTLQFPSAANAAVPVCSTATITGSARVAATLTASATCSNTPTSYTYQWTSSTTSGGTYSNIPSATSSTYTVQPSDAGRYFKVVVAGVNSSGTSSTTQSASAGPMVFTADPFVGSATLGDLDGSGTSAQFTYITSVVSDGSFLYVTDSGARKIKKIDSNGTVSTIVGSGSATPVDGIGTAAALASPMAMAYDAARNSLIVKDASVIREVNLTTLQVTTLKNRQAILSIAKSGTTVTVTFAQPHGFSNQSVVIAGVGAPYDGTFTAGSVSATTFTYTVGTSGTVASFNPVGATATSDLGPSRTNDQAWGNFYEAFQIAPDGNIYFGRGNYGGGNDQSYLVRLTRLSNDTFRYERLRSYSIAPCAIAIVSATDMFMNTCGGMIRTTTTDDWATVTNTLVASSVNTGVFYDPIGYVFYNTQRYDIATATTSTVLATPLHSAGIWEMLGDTLYIADDYGSRITRYVGAGSGLAVSAVIPTATVTFDANGGSGSMSAQVASSATNLTANTLTRTGYSFAGWNTAANGSGTPYANSASYPFTSSTTLYAQWTANSYIVTFDSQSGSAVSSSSFTTGGSLTLPAAPTRAGYAFTGWYAAASGGSSLSSPYSPGVTAAITLYAQWAANVNAVVFDANSGTGSMATQTGSSAANLTANSYSRTGYTFAGWNTAANGSGTPYSDQATYAFASNTTLYAQWSANTNTVTFDSQGGSAVASSSFNTGGSLVLPAAPTKSGFTFDGWFVAASGGSALTSPYSPSAANAITLYAQWSAVVQQNNVQQNVVVAPVFYPIVNQVFAANVTPGTDAIVILRGDFLSEVAAISCSSGVLTIVSSSSTELKVRVAGADLGKGWILLTNAARSLRVMDAFRVVEKPSVAENRPEQSSSLSVFFAGNSAAVNAVTRVRVAKVLQGLTGQIQVQIVGYTSSNRMSQSDKKLALARAKALSTIVKALSPKAAVVVRVGPVAGLGSENRRATITIKVTP